MAIGQFDFDDYAEQNPDLRAAFGIDDDFVNLTAAQETALFTHYLTFGFAEKRAGVSDEFSAILAAKNIINVPVDGLIGTIIDDEFRVPNTIGGMTLDGLGGNDSVVFAGNSSGMILRNIEEVIVDGSGARSFESLQLLDQITINAVSQVVAKFADTAVSGSNDELNLTLNANAFFITNGIEALNITLGSDIDVVPYLAADSAKGKLLTIKGSSTAKNDFTDIEGDFDAQLNTLRVEAGTKGDTFLSTGAIDVFVGGRGADTFGFSESTEGWSVRLDAGSGKIAEVDRIEGFGKGDIITGTNVAAIDNLVVTERDVLINY